MFSACRVKRGFIFLEEEQHHFQLLFAYLVHKINVLLNEMPIMTSQKAFFVPKLFVDDEVLNVSYSVE